MALESLSFGNGALQNEKKAFSSSNKKNFVEPQIFFAKRQIFFVMRQHFLSSNNIYLLSDKNFFVARAL